MSGLKLAHLPASLDKAGALQVLDALREEVEAGRVAAFLAVTIAHDDQVDTWIGKTAHVTQLRGIGAVSMMLAQLQAGEV